MRVWSLRPQECRAPASHNWSKGVFKLSASSVIPSANLASNLSVVTLDAYLGQSVTDFCGKYGEVGDSMNHCAHFVAHVLSLRVVGAALCSNVGGSNYPASQRGQGFCIRVNEIFNICSNPARVKLASQPTTKCFIVATTEGNIIRESPIAIGDHPKKHIGIFMDGNVYNFSNTKDAVVKVSLGHFKNHYGAKTILLMADLP